MAAIAMKEAVVVECGGDAQDAALRGRMILAS
jgi:hypothetical protein